MLRVIFKQGLLLPFLMLLPATMSLAQQQKAADEEKVKEIKVAIENYIKNDLDLKGAFFLSGPKEEKVVKLTFDELHKSVGYAQDGSPFVCADFRDDQGRMYDVDVYVNKADGKWTVKKLLIHKVDGQVRR